MEEEEKKVEKEEEGPGEEGREGGYRTAQRRERKGREEE